MERPFIDCVKKISASFSIMTAFPAWPISYEEMEPYYTQAEQMYQVHGEHGVDPTTLLKRTLSLSSCLKSARIQQLYDNLKNAGITLSCFITAKQSLLFPRSPILPISRRHRHLYMKTSIDIAGVAHQAGTRRFGKIPKLPYLISIAKRMNWTTYMS